MEDFIGIIFIFLFVEVIYWGVSYSTGYLLTPIVSFGKWRADKIIKDKGTGKKRKILAMKKIEETSMVRMIRAAVKISVRGMLAECYSLVFIHPGLLPLQRPLLLSR